MPNQTRSVSIKNPYIGAEWGKNGKLSDNTGWTRSQRKHRRKPKSDVTKAAEAAESRYNRRSNTCPTCHMLIPVGTGVCDNCE